MNNCTPADRFYMKQPEHMSSAMVGCRWYSSLDLRSGYLQCPILEEHQHRTAFWYRGKRWMYRRSPFGLRNSGVHFSKIMATAIAEAGLEHCCDCWVDDVIIFSQDFESHIQHVTAVLSMLLANGLRAHPAKSLFGAESVSFVGHIVSAAGLHPCPSKVEAIRHLQSPKSLKELQRAAGLMNFYRIYIPRYSIEARPIFDVMTPTALWPDCWGEPQETAFRRLIDLLCQPGNALRRADPTRQYILLTDFSNQGIAGLLCQTDPETNVPYMVAAISRSLNVHERAYASYKGEMLSVVYCVRSFRVYLLGVPFVVVTDHAPLVYLMTNQNLTGVYARWALMLSEYDMTIVHRPGADHEAPDCLSRDPLPSTEDYTGARMDLEPRPPTDMTALASVVSLAAHYSRSDPTLPPGLSNLVASAEFVPEADFPAYLHHISDVTALTVHGDGWIDTLDPSFDDDDSILTLSTHDGIVAASLMAAVPVRPDYQLSNIRRRAAEWVDEAWDSLPREADLGPHLSFDNSLADDNHVRSTVTLEGSPIPCGALLLTMSATGITLFEPFGGIAAGLEMCLRNGIRIARYIYSDISASARAIAHHRLSTLTTEYPRLLPPEAWSDAFSVLPQDVYLIGSTELINAGALDGTQWLVVAGFECQDLSPAGGGRGLRGARSSSFYPLVRIIGTLQQLQWSRPPLYLIENTAMQVGSRSASRPGILEDFDTICSVLGPNLLLDAARVDSFAARLRNYWTNMAPTPHLQVIFDMVRRTPGLAVNEILDPGRRAQRCTFLAPRPYYPANVIGQPLAVLPTLVSFSASHAFRDGGPGMVLDTEVGALVPLSIGERERALGYATDATAAPTATFEERHTATGNCMDANALQSILAVSVAYGSRLLPSTPQSALTLASAWGRDEGGEEPQPRTARQALQYHMALATSAVTEDTHHGPLRDPDIWNDTMCLTYIQ